MVEAFLVALAVFICVGGAELAGFTRSEERRVGKECRL